METKKVLIRTFFFGNNPGAFLQAIALYKMIEKLGYEPYILSDEEKFKEPIKEKLISILLFFKHRNSRFQLAKLFNKFKYKNFKNYLVYNHEKTSYYYENFDAFVVGSDQIFSPSFNYSNERFVANLIPFNKDKTKIAYACSFGFTKEMLKDDYLGNLKPYLNGFNAISIREKEGLEIISSMDLSVAAQRTLDPTFLFNKTEWEEFIKQYGSNKKKYNTKLRKKYILVFSAHDQASLNFAQKLSSLTGYPLYEVFYQGMRKIKNSRSFRNLNPLDLIDFINHATYIITGSYHGFILSLNMQKEVFYKLSNKEINCNSRFDSIISDFDLDEHNLERIENVLPPNIDYKKIEKKLSNMVSSSINFLKDALK